MAIWLYGRHGMLVRTEAGWSNFHTHTESRDRSGSRVGYKPSKPTPSEALPLARLHLLMVS